MIRSLPIAALLALASFGSAAADPPNTRITLLTSTVRIVAHKSEDQDSIGSGVIVGQQPSNGHALVLTAAHTLHDPAKVAIETFSVEKYPFPSHRFDGPSVRLVASSPEIDLALFSLETREPVPAPLPLCPLDRLPASPFAAVACGCSSGEPQPLLWNTAVQAARPVAPGGRTFKVWLTEGREPFNGESGGPLLSPSGYLIGICLRGSPNRGIYCHIEEIRRFLNTAFPQTPEATGPRPASPLPNPNPVSNNPSDAVLSDLFGPKARSIPYLSPFERSFEK
jgi:S1-C subfamily serine protease